VAQTPEITTKSQQDTRHIKTLFDRFQHCSAPIHPYRTFEVWIKDEERHHTFKGGCLVDRDTSEASFTMANQWPPSAKELAFWVYLSGKRWLVSNPDST